MNTLYLIRKRALGDVIWVEPIIRELIKKHTRIIFYTKYPEIFINFPYPQVTFTSKLGFFEKIYCKIGEILYLKSRVINLDYSYEKMPKSHILYAYQKTAGLPLKEEYPKIYIDNCDTTKKLIESKKYIVLHLESESSRNYRKIYGVEWEKIVGYLNSSGFDIVQVGKSPVPIVGALSVRTTLQEMLILIKNADYFIGLDSGPSHVAACFGIPSLIFFGAVNPIYRHFEHLFKGIFMIQYCEYNGCYHENSSIIGPSCKIVGDTGIPPCSLYTNEIILNYISLLFKKYQVDDKKDISKN